MGFLQDTFSGVGATVCNILGILFLIVGMFMAFGSTAWFGWLLIIVAIVLFAMSRAFGRR
jgi:multisubunit Na+/H+ antiporter MnhG subunit